jgi:Mg2+/Co2+ transporter CorC
MMISMDDVGGLSGFVDFLEKMDGKVDNDDDYAAEEQKNLRTWARSMGWSKHRTAPRSLL